MQAENGYLGQDSECICIILTWDQTLNEVTEWLPGARLLMQSRNGNLGPDSECSHRMVSWDQTLNAVREWLPRTRV
ncbi:hypothetical protein DPMN_090600 [Dreissena polymorpha]|uniref:Uncharacterized protein n=1 Tax=Dreissena polymorpha TaxID=45954 RepID=A0A9D4KYD3_DREPO|nr:hypothetical protein DPMN_090600 [Dreissena polymorpha]